jgi:hypothetical protein
MSITEKYVTVAGGGLHDGTSEANAWTFTEALANAVAGDRVNVKLGTHTCTTASTVNGTYADPIHVRGYVSTIGDLDSLLLGTMVGGTDIPLVQGTGNNIGFRGQWVNFSHIEFQGVSHYASAWTVNTASIARSCRFTNTNAQSYNCVTSGYAVFQDCYIYSPTIYSAIHTGNSRLIQCVLEGNNTGVVGANAHIVINCLIKNLGTGVSNTGSDYATVTGNTFVNCTTGINFNSYPRSYIVSSCYFSGCTTGIVNGSNGANNFGNVLVNSCCYHNVTTQISGIDFQHFASVDATDQFVDSAGGDYTLLPTSNGYSSAMPNILAGVGTTTKQDIGAIRHTDASPATQPSAAGTQIYPFRQFVSDKFGAVLHPLRSN